MLPSVMALPWRQADVKTRFCGNGKHNVLIITSNKATDLTLLLVIIKGIDTQHTSFSAF